MGWTFSTWLLPPWTLCKGCLECGLPLPSPFTHLKSFGCIIPKVLFQPFYFSASNNAEEIERPLKTRSQVCQMPNFYPRSRSAGGSRKHMNAGVLSLTSGKSDSLSTSLPSSPQPSCWTWVLQEPAKRRPFL